MNVHSAIHFPFSSAWSCERSSVSLLFIILLFSLSKIAAIFGIIYCKFVPLHLLDPNLVTLSDTEWRPPRILPPLHFFQDHSVKVMVKEKLCWEEWFFKFKEKRMSNQQRSSENNHPHQFIESTTESEPSLACSESYP